MSEVSKEQLEQWLSELRQGHLSQEEVLHVITQFTRADFVEAILDIEQLLTDADREVHARALEELMIWNELSNHWETARRFLTNDSDEECRMVGANALGSLKQDTQDRSTLSVLADVVRNDWETHDVRQAAYRAMVSEIRFDRNENRRLFHEKLDLDRDVDWSLVKPYLQRSLD